jgi:competence protein ComEC
MRRALAEGIAVTVSATLATAPLIAFHFETLSTTTLVANVLALPAVAPAMWLGMASAAAAQVPGLPVEALNGPNALLLAYIAQVAAWCGRPSWAELQIELDGRGLAGAYLALAVATGLALRFPQHARRAAAVLGLAAMATTLAAAAIAVPLPGDSAVAGPPPGLRIEILDVGQGDAILLRPAAAPAVLVDGGPPGAGIVDELEEAGVRRLGAAVVSHDQSDHAGGIAELIGSFPVARIVYARLGRERIEAARSAGAVPFRAFAGSELRSGRLRLEVLWPPRELLGEQMSGADPNHLALVLLARWRHFSMLLAADAEAEAVPLDPGPVDVLKVAHHGSDDAGLAALLDRIRPRLAVVSAGAGNPYGHPTAGTLATLSAHGARVLRTDVDGEVEIYVGRRSIEVHAED